MLASECVLNQDIAENLGMHFNSVAVWRNRVLNAMPMLTEVENTSPERPKESRWWAEIEYYDEAKGTYSRYRTIDLNQNAKLCVGKDVDIYRLAESVYVDFK